jgi:hypothetical protein
VIPANRGSTAPLKKNIEKSLDKQI